MTKAKSDIYQEITDTIIVQLETAGSDWIKNWSSSNIGGNININSKNSYRGIQIALSLQRGERSSNGKIKGVK